MRSVWEHRQVLRMLVLRDLQRKYSNFRLGYLWSLLEPLGMSMVLWFVFSVLLGARQLGQQPYFLFLALAILPWWWFTKGITAATKVFRRDTIGLRMSLLPTRLWVLRVILASMIEFLMSLPVIVIAMVATGTPPGPLFILFPVGIALQFLLMYGAGLLVSSVASVFPDLERMIRILLRTAFYLSPVLYSIANIPERVQALAALNPLVGIFGLYRIGFWPNETEEFRLFLISLVSGLVICTVGAITFHRLEGRILKEA
ncbi:MAG: ABC transporter permease [Actinomycetales bacterium]